MSSAVLDASAMLALLHREPGGEQVEAVVALGATISTVNLAEVIGRLADAGVPEEAITAALEPLALEIVAFDEPSAFQTGLLRPATRAAGLSLGDRACLSLARSLGLPVFTSDRRWIGTVAGVDVHLIR
jgi:PIN domain nuclease of toxin-antitoxin system